MPCLESSPYLGPKYILFWIHAVHEPVTDYWYEHKPLP